MAVDQTEAQKLDAERPPKVEAPSPESQFILQKVQPGLLGLMDGSVSTLAPIFAAAGLTHSSHSAFFVGLAASVGAGISMGLAEALSDDGEVSGRGKPLTRGLITGLATTLGGMLHTLPFLILNLAVALHFAYAVVVVELLAIAYIRYKLHEKPAGTDGGSGHHRRRHRLRHRPVARQDRGRVSRVPLAPGGSEQRDDPLVVAAVRRAELREVAQC